MEGICLVEPTKLFNLLNQGMKYSQLSDPNYLLLLDCRSKEEYNESHIITSKNGTKEDAGEFSVPYDAELECKENVVVLDGNTQSITENSAAVQCAQQLWGMGSRNPVKVLKGGYEEFSALYPFLRTHKIIYMPRELDEIKTYPTEIIPGFLYLGNWEQGNTPQIRKDLKVKGSINCCVERDTLCDQSPRDRMHIQVDDSQESDLHSHFQAICNFIDAFSDSKGSVLVFSKLGISRSATVVIAYLMARFRWSLEESYNHAKSCCSAVRPNRVFVEQLSRWEENILGEQLTTSDPNC